MWKKLIISILVLLLIPSVYSVSLGVSPAELKFDNVLKGGYAQKPLYLSTGESVNISMFFESYGEIADWIRIGDNLTYVTVSAGNPKLIKVIIEPPVDAANGNYTGRLRIITDKIFNPQTGIGSAVKAAFMVNIYLTITGDEIKACTGGGISFQSVETGFPFTFSLAIQNDGNVRVNPPISVNIWDKYQQEIVYSGNFPVSSILPTEFLRVSKEFNADIYEDQFWAEVNVPDCGFGQLISFDVVEKGGIRDTGDFIRIQSVTWAKTGEILPITATFKNTGPRVVTARLKGQITNSLGEIVKVIDTDGIDVLPLETVQLQTFFRPNEIDQYHVTGRIYYNNKLTGTMGIVININEEGKSVLNIFSFSIFWYVMIIISILIISLLILIEHKKKTHKRKKIKIRKKKR